MIYQDFALVPALTVTQNVFLGRERVSGLPPLGILNKAAWMREPEPCFRAGAPRPVGFNPRPRIVGRPATGCRYRARDWNPRQARHHGRADRKSCAAPAIAKVRETVLRLKNSGVSVVLISHRLEDIFSVGDRFIVMKHGCVVGVREVKNTHSDEIVQMIVSGTDPQEPPAHSEARS